MTQKPYSKRKRHNALAQELYLKQHAYDQTHAANNLIRALTGLPAANALVSDDGTAILIAKGETLTPELLYSIPRTALIRIDPPLEHIEQISRLAAKVFRPVRGPQLKTYRQRLKALKAKGKI
jgi:hypothetical protein